MRILLACLIFIGCSRATAPTLSSEDAGYVEIETVKHDTTYISGDTVYICEYVKSIPETIYIAKRIKIKDSYNVDNSEVTKLKNAVLIRDSQIDSLNILLGKKCVGKQTNNGSKWWIFVLLGIAIGTLGNALFRLVIKKKLG